MPVNPYVPTDAKIVQIRDETEDTKTFTFKLRGTEGKSPLRFSPGQFMELTVFGVGEAPISICSSPRETSSVQMSIRRIGAVTEAIHEGRIGDVVGLRGPYGNGWPVKKLVRRDIVLVAGGIGMAPLRSLMLSLGVNRSAHKVFLCYGARNPSLLMYKQEITEWQESADVRLTVDQGDDGWKGEVGVVTNLLDGLDVEPSKAVACVCGPPVMIKFTMRKMVQLGYKPENVYASLESMMKCGIGKCGHCHFGDKHVCLDGPVFSLKDMVDLPKGFAPV